MVIAMKLKELYFGYCPHSDKEFEEWWQTALFVFDANALLDFYSLEGTGRDELFAFLEAVKDRIWIPHQAGFEFHKNRVQVINQNVAKFKAAIGRLEQVVPAMKERAEGAQKDLDDAPAAVREVAKRVSASFEELLAEIANNTESLAASIEPLVSELQDARDAQLALIANDAILDRLTLLFGENVGDEYDEKRLKEVYAEGKSRYGADPKIPPGFMDEGNKKGNDIYGDLLVWYQTIDKAQSEKKPILMVNSEQKADWVETTGGQKRVRRELVQEMYRKAQQPFHIYSLSQFMRAAQKHLNASFSATTFLNASRVEQEEADKAAWSRWIANPSRNVPEDQAAGLLPLRFDGLYERLSGDSGGRQFLRFHEGGLVQSISTEADANAGRVFLRLSPEHPAPKGNYVLNGDHLQFVVSTPNWVARYDGFREGTELLLRMRTRTNTEGLISRYFFIEVDPEIEMERLRAEVNELDDAGKVTLLSRNPFVEYLKRLRFSAAEIVDVIGRSSTESEFYGKLMGISDGHLTLGVLMADVGTEEYKVLVNRARAKWGLPPLFQVSIEPTVYSWLVGTEVG